MGNACDGGSLRVISQDSKGNVKQLSEIDYCAGEITIKSDGEQVNIIITSVDTGINDESWIYKDGELKKNN